MIKKFLVFSALIAVLASAAISLANGGSGKGVIHSMTIRAYSVKGVPFKNGTTATLKAQNFIFKNVTVTFSVTTSATFNSNNNSNYFKGTIKSSGPVTGKMDGSSLSNLFINMSGFGTTNDAPKGVAVGQGTITGSMTHTDSVAKGGAVTPVTFSGAYSMQVLLGGFSKTTGNPTKGVILPMDMVISGLSAGGAPVGDVVIGLKPSAGNFTFTGK